MRNGLLWVAASSCLQDQLYVNILADTAIVIEKYAFRCDSVTGRYRNDRSSDVHYHQDALGEA